MSMYASVTIIDQLCYMPFSALLPITPATSLDYITVILTSSLMSPNPQRKSDTCCVCNFLRVSDRPQADFSLLLRVSPNIRTRTREEWSIRLALTPPSMYC
jgi:hypothetical protein